MPIPNSTTRAAQKAALRDLERNDRDPESGGVVRANKVKRPKTIDEIDTVGVYARFNNPPKPDPESSR